MIKIPEKHLYWHIMPRSIKPRKINGKWVWLKSYFRKGYLVYRNAQLEVDYTYHTKYEHFNWLISDGNDTVVSAAQAIRESM